VWPDGRAPAGATEPTINLALRNELLARAPADLRRELIAACEFVELAPGARLFAPVPHVYFPTSGAVALCAPLDGGHSLEVAVLSRRGILGPAMDLPSAADAWGGLVTETMGAWRLRSEVLERFVRLEPSLRQLLRRHAQLVAILAARRAACIFAHATPQRLAHWLLAHSADDLGSDILTTHAAMARLVGGRRSTVTATLQSLAAMGLVSVRRGHIVILDRPALQATSCSCYEADRHTRLLLMGLPGTAPAVLAGARG
jgi:CRP-like cAMP-binding protein